MDGLKLAYVWDAPAPQTQPGVRYAKAPTALPGFVPPRRDDPMWTPETSVPGMLEHLALTGLGTPSRRWEVEALARTGLHSHALPRGHSAHVAIELDPVLASMATLGLSATGRGRP